MKPLFKLVCLAVMAALIYSPQAAAQSRAKYEKLITTHAKINHVPEVLVHRVIVRESKYQPDLIGHGGTIGLMQIKLATARGVGYKGDAEGLRDPETNLTYGIKYLAGAYRAAEGDHDRAVRYFAGGYYYVAKRQRLERLQHPEPVLASVPKESASTKEAVAEPNQAAPEPAAPEPVEAEAKSGESVKPPEAVAALPKATSPKRKTASKSSASKPLVLTPVLAKPKTAPKKLADAKERIPRPPAALSGGANTAKPR